LEAEVFWILAEGKGSKVQKEIASQFTPKGYFYYFTNLEFCII